MIKLKEIKIWLLAVILVFGMASNQVQAQSMSPFISSSETLSGGAGKVDIVEVTVVDPNPFPVSMFSVGYFLDVKQSGVEVGSFAVSVSSLFNAPLTTVGWVSESVSAADWDSGVTLPNGIFSTTLGAYSNFFEPSSPGVAFFWHGKGELINESNDSDIFTDPADLQFGLAPDALPNSNTLVFDSGNNILDGSLIPEPSVALLGLLAFAATLRRRR